MKSSEELKKLERSISKSNAPSKTKPVTEPLFRNTGNVGAGMDRARLPQSQVGEVESEDEPVEAKVDPRKYIHTLRSSMANETNAKSTNTALNPTVGKV